MDEGDDFVMRLGKIHRAFHTNGLDVLASVIKTAEDMLKDRMCTRVKSSNDPLKDILAGRPVVTSDSAHVFVHTEDKVGVKFARNVVETSGDRLCICVSIDGPTTFTRNEFQNKSIQFLTCKFLCVNVTKHELVPKHTLLSDAASFDEKTLPLILDTDPIVQYFNWPIGGVVQIDRVFAGNEPIPYFRLISASS